MKDYLRKWLFPEADELAAALVETKKSLEEIGQYLSNISSFAAYVREKEEKADEVFETVTDLDLASSMSSVELVDALQEATAIRIAVMESPAIGSTEIREKNSRLRQIDSHITELTKATRNHVNPN